MILKNTNQSYGWVSISLHWLMAFVIFFLFGLGVYMVELTYYDAWYKGSLELHKSLGLVVFSLLLFRVFWRAINIKPMQLAGPKWEQYSAHWMHIFLYIVMLLLMISGYLISTAKGKPIPIFDLVHIPALAWSIDNQEDIAGLIHAVLAWSLIAMTVVHSLAAIKHQFINKNGGLTRILKTNSSV